MSGKSERSVFLARETYRQRRLRDVLRMVPVLGVVLWLLPLLWPGQDATGDALQYVFGVWIVLIVLAALLSRRLRPDAVSESPEDRD
ncbi:DUF6611 family protein [Yoonia sp. R2331]|uniref:DUF6611 family protein n=1 Tax=Yoonia sp. R2331 TaxID=3237238 RepID=UPI0034E48A2C